MFVYISEEKIKSFILRRFDDIFPALPSSK